VICFKSNPQSHSYDSSTTPFAARRIAPFLGCDDGSAVGGIGSGAGGGGVPLDAAAVGVQRCGVCAGVAFVGGGDRADDDVDLAGREPVYRVAAVVRVAAAVASADAVCAGVRHEGFDSTEHVFVFRPAEACEECGSWAGRVSDPDELR